MIELDEELQPHEKEYVSKIKKCKKIIVVFVAVLIASILSNIILLSRDVFPGEYICDNGLEVLKISFDDPSDGMYKIGGVVGYYEYSNGSAFGTIKLKSLVNPNYSSEYERYTVFSLIRREGDMTYNFKCTAAIICQIVLLALEITSIVFIVLMNKKMDAAWKTYDKIATSYYENRKKSVTVDDYS